MRPAGVAPSPGADVAAEDAIAALQRAAGAEGVLTGAATAPFVTDVYRRRETPLAVVRPDTVEALCAVVREAAARGLAMFPRGGGASYSDGYLPDRPHSVLIDLGRLDRVVEVNVQDAYVTVEAGTTWARLKAALDPLKLRTPFFGPFSGLAATVGGSVSQHSLSHGSGAHGVSAQSVLGLEVVTASGEIVRTGSAARGAPPFARFDGPDLTGLFTGDCGALGIKARVTLPLVAAKPASGCASFAFDGFADMAAAMRALAMDRLDDEHFGLDTPLAQGQIARQQGSVLALARTVLRSAPDLATGLGRLARMAAAPRRLSAAAFALHVIVEGCDGQEVAARLRRLRVLMAAGRELPDAVPQVVRATPFAPLVNTLGPRGERWVPLHGVLPHSQAAPFHAALQDLYAARAEEMRRLGVWTGAMFETVNPSGFLYEVALYWPGAQTDYHRAAVPAEHLAALPVNDHDGEAAAFVDAVKREITDLYGRFGAVHFQLGRTYPYAQALQPATLALLRAVKAALDPDGLMNPGVLGL